MHNISQKETTSNNNNELSFLYCKAILNDLVNNAIRTPNRKFYKNANYVKNFTVPSINITPKVYCSFSQPIEVNLTEISNDICDNKTIEHQNNIQLLNNNIHKIKSNSEIKKFSILQVQNNNLNNQNIKIHENTTTKSTTINDSKKSFIKHHNSGEKSGLKMSQLENNDTLRTEKLEIEIKKLIEEINADENNKKNVDTYLDGQGDVDVKLNRKSLTNNNNRNDFCGLNTKIRSESEFIINENDASVTRKFCRIDLLNHENKLHMACNELLLPEVDDVELEQDYWERSQEHELQVIDPEYSDSEEIDTDLQTFEAYGGEFFDIDLCCVAKIPQISDDSDTDNDVTNKVEFRKPLKMEKIFEKANVDDVVKPKSKKCVDLKSNNEKKSKKKRVWSFGNRIINFFTNKNRTADLHAGENKI